MLMCTRRVPAVASAHRGALSRLGRTGNSSTTGLATSRTMTGTSPRPSRRAPRRRTRAAGDPLTRGRRLARPCSRSRWPTRRGRRSSPRGHRAPTLRRRVRRRGGARACCCDRRPSPPGRRSGAGGTRTRLDRHDARAERDPSVGATPPAPSPSTTPPPTTPSTGSAATFVLPEGTKLQRGEGDPALVEQLQQALSKAGYDPGPADGTFGRRTEAAVVAFQEANGLSVDGRVGPETASALTTAVADG